MVCKYEHWGWVGSTVARENWALEYEIKIDVQGEGVLG